jgi:hypothetical protein
MFHMVKCTSCGSQYDGLNGTPVGGRIAAYVAVSIAIGIGILVFITMAMNA